MIEQFNQFGGSLLGSTLWPVVWSLIKIIALVAPLMLCVAYLTLWERKAIGWTQVRPGPNRVGPWGLLTPIADAVKLLFKEIIRPTAAHKGLFFLGPIMTIMPALAAWAVVPVGPELVVANVNAGLLYVMAITSLEVYGVIIAGWASNSKYAFLGALRASAQMVSYEIAMGFALVVVLMVSGTMNMGEIVLSQGKGMMADMGLGFLSWNWLPLLPIFVVYFIAGWASNSKYEFLGAMRSAAQMVSYEISWGFALVVVLMVSGSLNMTDIVLAQDKGYFAGIGINFLSWNWLPLLPITVVYFVSGVAETNRAPFDVVEGESEIVAGHMVEYSGMAFALFFLAEYANMWLISMLTVVMFFGGWQAPIDSAFTNWIPPIVWLLVKVFFVVSLFVWFRATFPRYRYDQIMRLGWKVFIPITLVWIIFLGAMMQTRFAYLFH